ncbi:MAG: hypothetical protein IJG65_06070 [Synergistaceae bacterium]|nr:hypothetical protein [Synergistaceae bacterium]
MLSYEMFSGYGSMLDDCDPDCSPGDGCDPDFPCRPDDDCTPDSGCSPDYLPE